MNTPIIENLLPRLRETVATQMKNYLGGEGELSGIYESLEFWWDGIRSREFPELPMWSDLPTPDQDRLFDEWISGVEGFFASRGKPVGPSNASGAGAPPAGTDAPRTLPWVDSTCCPACGCVGAHFCTGGQPSHPGWSAADQSLPVSVAQESTSRSSVARSLFPQWWQVYCVDVDAGYSAAEKAMHMEEAFLGGFLAAFATSCASPAPLVPEVVKVAVEALERVKKGLCYPDEYFQVANAALTALRSYSPAPSPSVELLREARKALDDLLRSSKRVSDKGAKTGPQWTDLTCSLLSAKPTLEKLNAALA